MCLRDLWLSAVNVSNPPVADKDKKGTTPPTCPHSVVTSLLSLQVDVEIFISNVVLHLLVLAVLH